MALRVASPGGDDFFVLSLPQKSFSISMLNAHHKNSHSNTPKRCHHQPDKTCNIFTFSRQFGLQSQKFNCFTLHILNIFKSHTYFYSNLTYNRFDVCLLWRLLVADTVVSHESSNMFNATYMSRPIDPKRNIMPILCYQSATYLVGCQNELFCIQQHMWYHLKHR